MLREKFNRSEDITHTAVTDDCARLAIHSPSVCAPFKEALSRHLDIARMGGVTRAGGKYVVPLLMRYREVWSEGEKSELFGQKLAFVLGWLCHRAAEHGNLGMCSG